MSRDLGLPSEEPDEMIAALRNVTAQSNSIDDMPTVANQPDGPPEFDFSTLRFVVKLVTSESGCYHDCENQRDPFDVGYDSDEDEDGVLDEDDDPWLKIYYVKIETKDRTRVGQFGYRVIDQSARKVSIWMSGGRVTRYYNLAERLVLSERGGTYLEGFGHALWNNNLKENPKDGNLKEEFVTGDRKGTGVFGTELNKGSLAVISDDVDIAKDDFFIREEFRGRGIGSWALKHLFQHGTLRGVRFIYASPWATRVRQRETSQDAMQLANNGVQSFFRKAGFRRVGQSEYFAYALRDANHPSRKLAIEDDADFKEPSTRSTDIIARQFGY